MIIKYSVEDLPSLNFRYVVQINNHAHEPMIFNCSNPGFWIEKRLAFISCHNSESCYMHGCYYDTSHKMTSEELVERLNRNDSRYYRLLNIKEPFYLI